LQLTTNLPISGKKVVLYFGLLILVGMTGVTLFIRVVLWPLMTQPHPHPATQPATQITTQSTT